MTGVEGATTSNGTVIGRYALYDEIAAGGMATIHIGRLLGEGGFSRPVAIKRLHPQFAKDSEFVAMFLEEARLAARIRHTNVVPVVDIVATEHELFLVMEFIQGETITRLTRVSRKRARIVPLPIALAIAADMLQGLHAAHEAKDEVGKPLEIVHRDISPHNIMVGRDGVSRVLDFGIAKAASSSSSTRDGEVKGKFAYMSPEQLSSERVDRRADIFAASIVLWEMVTGQRLFQAGDPAAIVGKVLHGDIKAPSTCAPGLPPAVDALILCGLERDRENRFSTALDMARALEKLGTPIARPTEVGVWVNRIAGDALKKRAARLAEIESTGSFSRDGAMNALAALNQPWPQVDNTGSHSASQSRSGLRPVSAPSQPSSPDVSASMSHPFPAMADASQAIAAAEPRRSHVARNLFLFVALVAAGAGVFVWRSGGVQGARARVASWTHVEPHGVEYGTAAKTAATQASTIATIDNAIDITNAPNATASSIAQPAAPIAHGYGRRHAAQTQTQATTIDPPPEAQTATPIVTQTGTVSARPGQGDVQAVIVPLMKSAKACFNPDDPPSRATITFQSDGTVKNVSVTGFAAGKPQEACVKGMVQRARLDPFSDATYTVPMPINP